LEYLTTQVAALDFLLLGFYLAFKIIIFFP